MSKMLDYIAHGGDKVAELEAALEHTSGYLGFELEESAKLRAENERLRKGIQDYLDGNYDHPRKHRHEKGMSCKHGRLYYAECCECDADHFSALLGEENRAPELKAKTGEGK